MPPSRGTDRNDLGAYGGPFAGRWTIGTANLPVVLVNGQPAAPLQLLTFPTTTPPVITFSNGFPGGSFRYTLDGSNPLGNPAFTNSPLVLTQSAVIRAIAYSAGLSSNTIAAPVTVELVTMLQLQPTGFAQSSNGSFGLGFSGVPSATYSVWGSTDLADWTFLGLATQPTPGQFQFTDTTATNWPARYYRVQSP